MKRSSPRGRPEEGGHGRPQRRRLEARIAPGVIIIGCVLAIAAYGSAFRAEGASVGAAIVLAVATALLVVGMVALGVGDDGARRGPLLAALAVILVAVGGGISAALLLGAPDGPDVSLHGGLPAGAAMVLYGVGLFPAIVVPLLHAWAFRDDSSASGDDPEAGRARESGG